MVSRNIATAELIVALSLMKTLDCNKHQLSQTLFSSQQRSVDPSPILSGFVFVDGVVLKIKRRLNLPSACKSVEFVNVPSNTTSPLTKKVTFDLILDNLYNGRYGWTNGADYISYFPSSDDSSPYGTWLLGNKPGFDSGYAFLKPTYDTLVPVGIEQSDWHWLEEKNWEKRPAIKLICNDNSLNRDLPERESVSNHFYQVEYFVGPTLHSGFYTPAHMVSPENSVPRPGMKDSERKMYLSLSLPSLWSDSRRDRISTRTGESFKVLCKAGGATMISDSSGKSAIGHLIQDEHRALGSGWSLIFRRVLGTKSEETLSGWNSQIEILIDIDSKGNMNEFSLRPLSEAEELSYMIPMKKSLENSKKGDYLWVWYSVLPEKLKNSKFSGSIDMNIDGLDSGEITSLSPLSTQLIEQKVEEEIEILLECVASSDSKILFKYHLAERRATMRQSILSKETHYFTYNKKTTTDTRNENENKNESREPIMLDQLNSEIQTNAIFFIGSDVIGFIKDYLEYKEKASNGLSSCFLYHAAVTLPRSLVYAAEIICVLTGAKAVTLVRACFSLSQFLFFCLLFLNYEGFNIIALIHLCYILQFDFISIYSVVSYFILIRYIERNGLNSAM